MLGRVFGLTSTAAFVGGGLAYAAGGPLLDATSAEPSSSSEPQAPSRSSSSPPACSRDHIQKTSIENQMLLTTGPGAHRAEERNASSRRPPGPFQKLGDALTAIRTVKRDGEPAKGPGVSD